MRMAKRFMTFLMGLVICAGIANAGIFSEDERMQGGLDVIEMSNSFADIFSKLDEISWGGKNINVAIENLEQLNPKAHIAATDERVVLVWGDTIVANYPRPAAKDWNSFGEITTALVLKMRERDANLRAASPDEIYQTVVNSTLRGIGQNGQYVFPRANLFNEGGQILTSVGIDGYRDERGNFRVTGIYGGSPAEGAGISVGDLIAEINGVLVADLADAALAEMMSGAGAGTLKMMLLTPSGNRRVVVRRATVVLADADIIYLNAGGEGGVLQIIVNRISENTIAIVTEALARHKDLSGVILDLRATGGADEKLASKLAGLFIGNSAIMRIVQDEHDEVEVFAADEPLTEVPVVVIVSNTTSGTAEAIAAAFYETGRGILIGTPTAGMARVASNIKLQNGGILEVMNKSIKSGEGKTIDGRGVFPLVCLSSVRTEKMQNVFFLNVINNDFKAHDFNKEEDLDVESVRAGCPVIRNGADEDWAALSVASKILTDKKLYNNLLTIQ